MDSSALASSIAALRSSINALESRSDSLEAWLYLWVTLVVAGVVLEVGFVAWEYREDMVEFRRGIIHSPHKPSGRKLLIELLGACLVAIGVAGELAIDVMGGRVQTDLRAKNGDLGAC
jgi:predicted small integral membrane protein